MVQKRTVRNQQDSSRRGRQQPAGSVSQMAAKDVTLTAGEDRLAHLRPIADAFNAAIAQCVQDADPEAVHRTRTGSRRVQATVEAILRENGAAGNALRQPARAWLRQLKRIRRDAGPVRDLDVHRKLLESWIGEGAATQDPAIVNRSPVPPATKRAGGGTSLLRNQAEKLDTWLKEERNRLGRGMQKRIGNRQQALTNRQSEFFAVNGRVHQGRLQALRPADAVALDDFMRAVDAMPVLHAENLHDFRKATKKARYVAESGAEDTASDVAKALKRVQDAIGVWHDWLCLAAEAKAALGQNAPELAESIDQEVERQFAMALKTTQSMRGRLAGEWLAGRGSKGHHRQPAKRPAVGVEIGNSRSASNF
jgi:CHAD domain-containing protein